MGIKIEEVEIAKEAGEILDLAIETIKVVKNKGSVATLVDDLVKAIDGASELKDELKNRELIVNTVGLKTGEIVNALLDSSEDA